MNWTDLANAPIEQVVAWAGQQPWSGAMRACLQDADWHAEGDVWTHTQMVCAELSQIGEWADLLPQERTVLSFTALLHDVAKPLTTRLDPITGRTTSPKHAVKGEHVARGVLRGLGCPLVLREEIARMVRYHGRPAFLLERTDPASEVVRLSWMATNRLLFLIALADTRGRTTAETTRPEENLHLWRMVAEEQGCYTHPFRFANDQARFLFFREPSPSLHYAPHEQYKASVTMMSGLPGSGKDRWLAVHRPGTPVVSLDGIRNKLKIDPSDDQGAVIQAARERCRELLRAGASFAFNATNVIRQTRRRWIDLFADYGARIELVYIEPPLATVIKQNADRASAIPEAVIHRLAARVEPPTWGECHNLVQLEGAEATSR
ncbi:HD domain protein [Pirellulimonas nuda]|uniref:HD domain protein n=1 Tax=Pirellulimonas nuda TaxID=2528009 RepID=A0A518DBZ6_9BACT|nr:AAA family ATPase [Pirellulimonas nuda]QDU88983.1 HD domain protein [Pirellulimonas nuda]